MMFMTTAATSPVNLERLRSWIGREEVTRDVVHVELLSRFRATFDLPAGSPGNDPVPHLFHFCLAQSTVTTNLLATDGHAKKCGFLPPVPLSRRMWAGSRLSFERPLSVGDHVRRRSRIADVVAKQGRTGQLCFVTVEHVMDVDGRVVLNEAQDIVYRGGCALTQEPAAAPSDVGSYQRRVEPSVPFLFRYSALTFNSHRVHYDRRYACEVEGYPGLVVHGPLQATLLINLATELHGRQPTRFAFRSVSPLFDDTSFVLHAREGNGTLKLWTARENGPPATFAEADWA
jgi:3-methylfumaryl-CoA hydratase